MEGWLSVEESQGSSYEVSYMVKTMTPIPLSILMNGRIEEEDAAHPYSFKYTYNIDLNTGDSIRLKDHVNVEKAGRKSVCRTGYYVEESWLPTFRNAWKAFMRRRIVLQRSLEGYDYAEDGSAPYGYSYLADGKVWICMGSTHALGDYIEIELMPRRTEKKNMVFFLQVWYNTDNMQ